MHWSLKASLLLNLGLAGGWGLGLLSAGPRAAVPDTRSIPAEVRPSPPPAPAFAPPRRAQPSAPIQWHQLLSSADYRGYVANLRQVGCPASTLRDIVQGDTARAFAHQRKVLNLDGAGRGPWSRFEESQLVASLLEVPAAGVAGVAGAAASPAGSGAVMTSHRLAQPGSGPGLVAAVSVPAEGEVPSTSISARREILPADPMIPLVFREVDPSMAQLNAANLQMIDELRQNFTEAIGGPGQDPADPAYLKRWQSAQSEADAELKSRLGIMGWAFYQAATWNP